MVVLQQRLLYSMVSESSQTLTELIAVRDSGICSSLLLSSWSMPLHVITLITCVRAEKQRNEALLNAEELTRAFQQYKKNVAEKLETVRSHIEPNERVLLVSLYYIYIYISYTHRGSVGSGVQIPPRPPSA